MVFLNLHMTEDFITEFRGGASAPPFTCHRRKPDDLRALQRATILHVTGASLMTYARLSALLFYMSQAYRREYGA